MDRLLAMQTFVRVVETGSFSAVAREQHTTQSAVSKQVAALERHLGARLLTRTTRSLALTEDGTRYFETARRLVAEVAEAETSLRQGEQQLQGWLRVAAAVAFGRLVLLPEVGRFMAKHPAVRVDLRLNDGFVDLVEQGIDVAVRIGDLADSSLVARRIGTAHRALIASRDYLDALPPERQVLQAPAELMHHACIVYTELAMGDAWPIDLPDGTQIVVPVESSLQTNSSEVIRGAVLAGMGVCYAPTWLFRNELLTGEVRRLAPGWPPRPMPVHLVSPAQRRHAAKVRAFGDHMARAIEDALTPIA
ncbi:MAG: LysR family transcriptional regulator [Burkholderiales bacterium]|nr:LysR family transcriptional regulator [Burkholderiales bacterium]